MPTPSQEFNSVIESSRNRILDGVRNRQSGIRDRIREALSQVDPPQGELTQVRAARLKQQYNEALQDLSQRLKEDVRQQKQQAQKQTAEAHTEAILAAAAIAAGVTAASAPTPEEYAPQVAGGSVNLDVNARRDVDRSTSRIIDDSVRAAGKDVSEAIEDARDEGETGAFAVRKINRAATGDSSQDLDAVAQLFNNLKRTFAHEVAAYLDEASKTLTALNPAVDLVRWELSGRHDTLESSPDVCDVLETADLYGYGDGLYHPATVPSLPHPWCECRQSVVLKDDWTAPDREVPEEPDVDEDFVQGVMVNVDGERTVTDSHARHQTEMMESVLSAVHNNPRGG